MGPGSTARLLHPATVMFAVSGFLAYIGSLWLLKTTSAWLIIVVSIFRLMFAVAPAAAVARFVGWQSRGSIGRIALATPYPVDLAVFVYWQSALALPDDWATRINSPATMILFVAAVLFASRRLTAWAIAPAVGGVGANRVRRLGGLLFGLTAASLIFGQSPSGVFWFLSHVAEPLALVGYCAIVGADPSEPVIPETLSIAPIPPVA